MIRVYFLPVLTIDGTEQVAGTDIIHGALLETTEEPNIRKLTMNTTVDEDDELCLLAVHFRDANQEEIDRYNAQVIIPVLDPETIRAEELLASSPDVITQPEIWELLRIFGRRLGYRF